MVGEKLNAALEKIPWKKIQNTCNKIAKSIATFLNGFLETTNWKLVGSTIAKGLNTAFGFVNTFAKNFHWKSLGRAISVNWGMWLSAAWLSVKADGWMYVTFLWRFRTIITNARMIMPGILNWQLWKKDILHECWSIRKAIRRKLPVCWKLGLLRCIGR